MSIHQFLNEIDTTTGTTPSTKNAITASLLTSGESHSAASNFNTASISPTANKLIVLFCKSENTSSGTAAAPTGITGAGLTFTKVREVTSETGWSMVSVWVACSASVSSAALTISHAVSKNICQWMVMELTNAKAVVADNGLGAIKQALGVSTGGSDTNVNTSARLSEFLHKDFATIMGWIADTAANVPTTTTASGFTELVDTHVATGLGWDIHQSLYFKATADKAGLIVASQAAASNFKGVLSLEVEATAAATGAYTMPAAAGVYAVTGQTANLKWGHKLAAGTAAYTVSGQTAGLFKGRTLVAAAGAYTYSGQTAGLKYSKKVAAAAASYSVTGSAVGMYKGRTLTAGTATYAVTGFTTNLLRNRQITAVAGAYTWAGQVATLTYSSAKKLVADPGAYVVNGATAGLKYGRKLPAGADAYVLIGSPVDFIKTIRDQHPIMVADLGVYLLTHGDTQVRSSTPVFDYTRVIHRRNRRLGTG